MVISVDLRAHSDTDPAIYATDKMGDDISAVADVCHADQFLLFGFSFGGNISRYLAVPYEADISHSKVQVRIVDGLDHD